MFSIETSGQYPSNRTCHNSWYEYPNFFIYGGITKENTLCNDLYCLNTENFKWKKFFIVEGPYNRISCAFTTGFECRFLIGGSSLPENLLLNDVWFLDFSNVDWRVS